MRHLAARRRRRARMELLAAGGWRSLPGAQVSRFQVCDWSFSVLRRGLPHWSQTPALARQTFAAPPNCNHDCNRCPMRGHRCRRSVGPT
jgi:hypothetical protein